MTKSWLDYGFKCQEIYRRSREKIPVFPTDWLIVENIMNIDKTELDLETRLKLKDIYLKLHKEEKKQRDILEKMIRSQTEDKNK